MRELLRGARDLLAQPVTGKLIALALGAVLVLMLARVGRRAVNHYVDDSDSRYKARKLVGFGAFALLGLYVTVVFRDLLGGLTITFGIIGAAAAFGLKEVFASVAAWLAVTFGRTYRVGDRIEIGSVKGDVIDIGVLRTTLMEVGQWVKGDLYSGRIVRMANSAVFQHPVLNYSADFPFLWDEIIIPLRFGSDRALARQTILAAAQDTVGSYVPLSRATWNAMVNRYRVEPASVEPMVSLVATDNWLEFTLRYVVDYRARRRTRDALFTRILDDVDASQGRLSLASATFEVVSVPRMDVVVHSASTPG